MPLYRYRAVDPSGKVDQGTMEEASSRRVTAILQERGLEVSEVTLAVPEKTFLRRAKRLSWQDIHFLNSQILAFTRSGLPLAPALQSIAKELRRGNLRDVVNDLHVALDRGDSVSVALDKHTAALPPVYLAAIRAGDETGNLPAVLEQCSAYSAQMVALRTRIRGTLAYPAFVLLFTLALLGFLLTNVVPEFAQVFNDFGATLPRPTLFWIGVSEIVQHHYGGAIAALCVVVVIGLLGVRTTQGRYALDWLKLKTWGVGRTFTAASMARFCRSLGVLLAGRAPLDASIELASATCGNAVLHAAAHDAMLSVRNGTRLALAFELTGYFGGLFCWLIETSESRGDVHETLLDLAQNYDESFQRYSRTTISIVTPLILLFMAGIVISIIFSLYLPIFTLADVISGQ